MPSGRPIYDALKANNKVNDITPWLAWFAATAIEAERRAIALVEFLIDKTRLLDRLRDQLNDRQQKALLRMLREDPQGFEGGLSASKYIGITGAPPATATRDLSDLVAKGALVRAGERRNARYDLGIPQRPVSPVTVDDHGDLVKEANAFALPNPLADRRDLRRGLADFGRPFGCRP